MNAHPDTKLRMILQRLGDFQGAEDRRLWIIPEDERAAVTRRQTQQFAFGLGGTELICSAHDFPQLLNLLALVVNAQLGVTNDVDE